MSGGAHRKLRQEYCRLKARLINGLQLWITNQLSQKKNYKSGEGEGGLSENLGGCGGGGNDLFIYLLILVLYWFSFQIGFLALAVTGTHSTDQSHLKLRNSPAAASQMMGMNEPPPPS